MERTSQTKNCFQNYKQPRDVTSVRLAGSLGNDSPVPAAAPSPTPVGVPTVTEMMPLRLQV